MKLRIGILLSLALLGGCKRAKRDDGPSCRQIVSYMLRMPDIGPFEPNAAIAECRRQKWNATQRTCMYNAKNLEAMSKCVPPIKLERPALERPALPSWHTPLDVPIQGAAPTPAPGAPPAAPAPAPAAPAAAPAPAAPAAAPAPAAPAPAAKP